MKLDICQTKAQPDPYVIKSGGKYYMYVTGRDGVGLYASNDMKKWTDLGVCFTRSGHKNFWAPAVTEIEGMYYLYYSSMPSGETDTHLERLSVAVSDRPEGPFVFIKEIAQPFSIDPHTVISGGELYIFYSVNDYDAERAGTLIVVDKMKNPTELCGSPKVVVRATLDQEIFKRDRFKQGQQWHTLEGAFYFRKGNYHYLTYSGNCYENENYYIGYAVAEGDTADLTALDFKKYPSDDIYAPLIAKNDTEEGTGHNSILEDGGKLYLFYHGRDYGNDRGDRRTARVCEIAAENGKLLVIKR